jgi:hypothetical protein
MYRISYMTGFQPYVAVDRGVNVVGGARLPGPAAPEQLTEISDGWRPYRTWVTLLLRTQQEIPAAGELRWG